MRWKKKKKKKKPMELRGGARKEEITSLCKERKSQLTKGGTTGSNKAWVKGIISEGEGERKGRNRLSLVCL